MELSILFGMTFYFKFMIVFIYSLVKCHIIKKGLFFPRSDTAKLRFVKFLVPFFVCFYYLDVNFSLFIYFFVCTPRQFPLWKPNLSLVCMFYFYLSTIFTDMALSLLYILQWEHRNKLKWLSFCIFSLILFIIWYNKRISLFFPKVESNNVCTK